MSGPVVPSPVDRVIALDLTESKPKPPLPVADVVIHEKPNSKSWKSEVTEPSSVPDWDPKALFKDVAWFAKNCGLPNEGETPIKISDVTDLMLSSCFGMKTRNGYKMSTCTGMIPVEEILALSQCVDGYDKPVNGVLSHTFAKGAYAERVLKRKVNWAAYAATKLRGQILQIHRDLKPKPDGPPWIRKPTMYAPPKLAEYEKVVPSMSEGKPILALELEYHPTPLMDDQSFNQKSLNGDLANIASEPSMYSPATSVDVQVRSNPCTNSSELLNVISKQAEKMKARYVKIASEQTKLQCTIEKLRLQELGQSTAKIGLSAEICRLEEEVLDLQRKIQQEDDAIEQLTSDIELETNKDIDGGDPDEENSDLLNWMILPLAAHGSAVLNWTSILQCNVRALESTKEELNRKRKHLLSRPKTLDQLHSLSAALEHQRRKVESHLNDQKVEEGIVGRYLSKPCLPLAPQYVLTSTNSVLIQTTVSSCPLCCNGYHCNNWVPTSCGHTYHPVCLFTHLTSQKSDLQCLACGEALTHDWLRSWGLDTTWRNEEETKEYQMLLNENEDIYGKDCNRLPRRRQWVQNIEKLQTKDERDETVSVSGVRSKGPSSMSEEQDLTILEEE